MTRPDSGIQIMWGDDSEAEGMALADIVRERFRQLHDLGYDTAHDDKYGIYHLVEWAHIYLRRMERRTDGDPRANLVKAGALIVAAIEAYDRGAKE